MEANRRPPDVWNRTSPAARAYSVSSLPFPTPVPGWMRVPRWRTMIVPAGTAWPPKAFTPSRFDSESRPFLDAPPPFLCAMASRDYQLLRRLGRSRPRRRPGRLLLRGLLGGRLVAGRLAGVLPGRATFAFQANVLDLEQRHHLTVSL